MWWIPRVESLLNLAGTDDVLFDHCMHGGRRNKTARLRCHPSAAYSSLHVSCDNSHVHAPWGAKAPGQFYTAEEAEFPELLCERIATIASGLATNIISKSSSLHVPNDHDTPTVPMPRPPPPAIAVKVAASLQPRGERHPPLIPEFRAVSLLPVPHEHVRTVRAMIGGRPNTLLHTKLPHGTKVLSLQQEQQEGGCPGRDSGDSGGSWHVHLGIPWSPEEFVEQAHALEHPFDSTFADDRVLRSLFKTLTSSPRVVKLRREQALDHWRHRARSLQAQEAGLKEAVHPDVRNSIQDKSLLVFKEMLDAAGFPNAGELIHAMSSGFPLVGDVPPTGLFPDFERPASSSLSDLWGTARSAQKHMARTVGPSGDSQMDAEVSRITAEEVSKGWLKGPFEPDQLSQRLGLWVPARRFGIRQGAGVRVIDDLSERGHNATVSTHEKIDTGGIDAIAGIAKTILSAVCPDTRAICLELSDGTALHGFLHPEWNLCDVSNLRGKLWDLSKAYKQLARSPAHASFTIVAVWNHDRRCVEYYEQLVLPFGGTASVYNFNWVARGILFVMIVLLVELIQKVSTKRVPSLYHKRSNQA